MSEPKRKSKGPVFQVKALEAWRTPGNYCDHEGGGLYFQVRQVQENGTPQVEKLKSGKVVPKVTKYWVFRYWFAFGPGPRMRKLKEYGIGPFNDYSLQEARDRAKEQRKLIRDEGADPILTRKFRKQQIRDRIEGMKTFKEVVLACWEAHKTKWKAQTARNWLNSLVNHAYPTLGGMEFQSIKTTHIEEALKPIWIENPTTGSRVRQRLEVVFNFAMGKGWYLEKNPAKWEGNLDALLVESQRFKNAENHPSLPFQQVGTFIDALHHDKGTAAKALEFGILTGARSGEIRFATWDEINFDKALWTVPKERMKAGIEHKVPLSGRAVEILKSMGESKAGAFIFPGGKEGKALSDTSMLRVIERMDKKPLANDGFGWRDPKGARIVPHGFRATFKTWAQDWSHFDSRIVEFALAHQLENKVEAAYSRGTAFEKRRPLMEAWAAFCESKEAPAANVIPIRAAQ